MKTCCICLLVALFCLILSAHAFDPIFDTRIDYDAGDSPTSVAAADLNGDGYYDLVVTNELSYNVSVLKNNGDGTFGAAVNYYVGDRPQSVVAADLDSDGHCDLAVASGATHHDDHGSVSILKNQGNGSFMGSAVYHVQNPVSIVAMDTDGDNDFDLAVVDNRFDRIIVLENQGIATYVVKGSYSVGDRPHCVTASDLDDDGDVDLAVANYYSNTVSVLKNGGAGSYTAAVNYSAGNGLIAVIASDLDGDGDCDLATANYHSNTVSVLKNKGDGTFAAAAEYDAGPAPVSVMASDLDGDGDNDLVAANGSAARVSVLRNNGDGTYTAAEYYSAGDIPKFVTAADFDGDGDYDLAVANNRSDNISVLSNATDTGPEVSHVFLDIKPGSCPNSIGLQGNYETGKSVVPVAIAGSMSLDVREIDVESVTLNGLSPTHWSYEDVATPFDKGGDSCACSEDGPDGYEDLTLKFDKKDLLYSLNSAALTEYSGIFEPLPAADRHSGEVKNEGGSPERSNYILMLSGSLKDGTAIEGYDCVRLITKTDESIIADDGKSLELNLGQNYPNPFNPYTEITFSLPEAARVKLDIYNILGQRVSTVVDEALGAGSYSVTWDGSQIASGLYIYHLWIDDTVITRKMILLK